MFVIKGILLILCVYLSWCVLHNFILNIVGYVKNGEFLVKDKTLMFLEVITVLSWFIYYLLVNNEKF